MAHKTAPVEVDAERVKSFNGNPLTLAASKATLQDILTP